MHILTVRFGRVNHVVAADLRIQLLIDCTHKGSVLSPETKRPTILLKQSFSIEVGLKAAVDLSVATVVLGTDSETM